MSKFVTVHTFPSRIEAELAKSLLESHEVNSIVMADDAGGMRPYPMSYSYGVELKVSEEDAEKARSILQNQTKK